MNDRFKFRVWDKKIREMFNDIFSFCGDKNDVASVNEILAQNALDNNNALMQCTGLKDRNGTLIYEGDIVIEHYHNTKETAIKKVFFDESVIGFAYTDGIEYNQLSISDGERLQVIGNIYENKELLESRKTND